MKKSTITFFTLFFLLMTFQQSHADDKAVNGLLIGMGSGALLGQAIGGDTEATVMGTAVGGILGYVIGHDQQRNYRHHHRGRYVSRSHRHFNNHGYSSYGNSRRYQEHRGGDYVRHRNSHHNNYHYRVHRRDRDNSYNNRGYHRNDRQVCRQTERTIYKNGRSKTIVKKVCTNDKGGESRGSHRRNHRDHGYR